MNRLRRPSHAVRDDRAVALTEFAFAVPVLLVLGLVGAEFANYITTRMRVSQIALQLADNAARMGTGTPTGPKTISETEINDVLTGGQLESSSLDLKTNGRVILTDLEPMPKANPTDATQYRIVWQRCYGDKKSHASIYGSTGDQKPSGIGPAGYEVQAQDNNATMFVEVYYEYQPLLYSYSTNGGGQTLSFIPERFRTQFKYLDEIASMAVRDQRELTGNPASPGIKNAENATKSTC